MVCQALRHERGAGVAAIDAPLGSRTNFSRDAIAARKRRVASSFLALACATRS
jgi:hypothetical protein